MPQTSKKNLKKEEEDVGVILELPKNVGCTSNNVGAPSNTPRSFEHAKLLKLLH